MTHHKKLITLFTVMAIVASACAANVHLKGRTGIKVADQGDTLQVCASLAGLGNCDLHVTINAVAEIETSLTNPAGNVAPGNSVGDLVSGTITIPSTQIKNGNVSFCVSTEEVQTPTWQEAGAPNQHWTVTVEDVTFIRGELIVEQCGQIVFQRRF